MSPWKPRLTRIMTTLPVAAFALTAVAGTDGVPVNGPDPISAPAPTAAAGTLGLPVTGPDPVSRPAIFEEPFD